jgi:hypothetical protein
MRPLRRFPLLRCGIIFSLLAVLSGATFAQSSNPLAQRTQLAQSAPAAQPQLSAKWNDAVRALAEKIASAAGPSHEISLDVKNISTLDPVETTAIRQAVQIELRQHELLVTPVRMSEAQVQVTLSEGTGGRVFVAEIHHGAEQQISLLPAPSEPAFANGRQRETLTLTTKLVWEQPEKILDFMLLDGIPELQSILLVVETDRLVFYHSSDSPWNVSQTIPIPRSRPAPRDIRGLISFTQNKIMLTDALCIGRLTNADDIHCSSLDGLQMWVSSPSNFPGHERALATALAEKCNGGQVFLASGTGDWTQPDSLQAIERMQTELPPISAGNTLSFEGPILSLVAAKDDVVARVVVHNLKSGNYEAYLVTATCSH